MRPSIIKVDIQNFRSIRRVSVECRPLTTLVGLNDSGKSNILRALNLFFNDEVNHGEKLDFNIDYNYNSARKRKAKEISVSVHFELPDSYRSTNGRYLEWTKKWRSNVLSHNNYIGYNIITTKRGAKHRQDINIPAKSNVHALLRQIEFLYVPAIKDTNYFSRLRSEIYGVISEVASQTFRESSTSFEKSIGEHLADLTSDIKHSLDFEARLALPRDLGHVFERLDFVSGERDVSLDSRGDGVKARHIPLILKFMAEQKQSIRGRGAMPYTSIWGYEEPENNLEFTSALKLSDDFIKYAEQEICQLILTTHSPVFYNIPEKVTDSAIAKAHFVTLTETKVTEVRDGGSEFDTTMGLMPLIAPKLLEIEQRIRKSETDRHIAERLAEERMNRLFVEGESDRLVFQKALRLFFPNEADRIRIETKEHGAGHRYVIDMLTAWRQVEKHHPGTPRSAGIVDRDAIEDAKIWNASKGSSGSCYCFYLKPAPHLYEALQLGFKMNIALEALYPPSVWDWLHTTGCLIERRPDNYLLPDQKNEILIGSKSIDQIHLGSHPCYIKYEISAENKIKAARHVIQLSDKTFADEFAYLKDFLEAVVHHLLR